jgi:hypothetical protein
MSHATMPDSLMNMPAGPDHVTQPPPRGRRQTQVPLGERRAASLVPTDTALAVALGVLLLGFALPQVCTVLQILLIAGFILHGSAAWLPAIVALLLTPTDFKAGGMDLQYEKFEGVTVYILGFPMTASYAIVGAVLVRGLLEYLGMPRVLQRGLHRLWLMPVAIGASVCVYSGILALDARTPGWSAAARATLLLVSLWYAVALTRDWTLVRDVMMRRMGPFCTAIVACGFFAPVFGIFTCFYLSMAVGWGALVGFGSGGREYPRMRPLAWAALAICLAVPIGGLRISPAVAAASYIKMGNTSISTMSLAMTIIAVSLAVLHGRVVAVSAGRSAWLIATVVFLGYVSLPFFVAQFSTGKEFDTEGNTGSLRQRITYKFLVERPAIWRGSIEVLSEPPYVIVPPNRAGSIITAGGQRLTFRHSAHNLVLEILRSQGLLSGAISLLMLYVCFVACVRAYATVADPAACLAAITFIVGGLVNGVGVGHLLETGTGFMLYVCAGIAMGALAWKSHVSAVDRTRQRAAAAAGQPATVWSGDAARDRLVFP